MKLDCIEDEKLGWVVVDLEDSGKVLSSGNSPDSAWFVAAIALERRINYIGKVISGEAYE